MKKVSLCLLALALTLPMAYGQDTATQQQIDKLTGMLQDIQDAQAAQSKRIDQLEKDVSDLRDKVNAPVVKEDYATHDQLKSLADQLQEIDQKRQDDRKLILDQIEKLGNTSASIPTTSPRHTPKVTPLPTDTTSPQSVPSTQYEYVVQKGDNLGIILKAYRDKGVKVSLKQVIAANPTMNPNVLIPNEKIYIPDASAK